MAKGEAPARQLSAATRQKKQLLELRTTMADFLSKEQVEFFMSQLRGAIARKDRGRRWTTSDKAFALSLLHSSPKTYRLLRQVFALPSVPTLRAAVRHIQVQYIT